jgi:hypothetical protein
MTKKVSFKNAFLAGLMAAGTAAAVNAILFFIFHAAGLITDDIEIQPGQHMTVVPVLLSSIMPTLIACIVFWVIERLTKRGIMIFTIVSIVLLLLSFSNPFVMIPNVTIGYGVALNVLHVVVVASLLFYLRRAVKKAANS